MEYICKYGGNSWIGTVTECEFKTDTFEIRVNGRESDYYVIVGSCQHGTLAAEKTVIIFPPAYAPVGHS